MNAANNTTQFPLCFDGPAIEPQDIERLGRQCRAVFDLMRDGHWRTLREIAGAIECSETSASARLRDFRKERFGSHVVNRRRVVDGLFEYQVVMKQ